MQLADYPAQQFACRACQGKEDVLFAPRKGTGPERPKLMLVGQNPPTDKERSMHGAWLLHYPTIARGPHEDLMYELIEYIGYRRSEVWATQAVKCPTPSNQAPTRSCALRCAQKWLRWEIYRALPSVILAMGDSAHDGVMWAMMGNPFLNPVFEVAHCEPVGRSFYTAVRRWHHRQEWLHMRLHGTETSEWSCRIVHAPHPSKVTRFINKQSWLDLIKEFVCSSV